VKDYLEEQRLISGIGMYTWLFYREGKFSLEVGRTDLTPLRPLKVTCPVDECLPLVLDPLGLGQLYFTRRHYYLLENWT
jgi:hypothetical protein